MYDISTEIIVAKKDMYYDFNGNLVQDAENRQFTYNGEDKPTVVRNLNIPTTTQNPDANVIGRYFYDGEGKRVKKVTNLETTIFVYDAAGSLAAEYSTQSNPNPTISYLTTDDLGSPRIVTDKSGNVISRRDFMPFGEEILAGVGVRDTNMKYSASGIDNIRQRFTGYEKDAETDLDFAEARMYKNSHGRFTAPDPLLASASLANPQTFNRYSYVGSNPINLIDPSGLNWCRRKNGEGTFSTQGNTPCPSDSNDVTGKEGTVTTGSPKATNGEAKPGDVVFFNKDNTLTIVAFADRPSTQSVENSGSSVQSDSDPAGSSGASIGDHLTSTFMTVMENNGGSVVAYDIVGARPYDEHTETGQFAGNVLTLIQGLGEIAYGAGATVGGGILTGVTAPACATGVGCLIPATTAAITATGLAAITHGTAVIGTTVYNMSSHQGDGSRSGSSSSSDNKSSDYDPRGRGKVQTFDDALDQLEGISKKQEAIREGKAEGVIDSIEKSKGRVKNKLNDMKGKSLEEILNDIDD